MKVIRKTFACILVLALFVCMVPGFAFARTNYEDGGFEETGTVIEVPTLGTFLQLAESLVQKAFFQLPDTLEELQKGIHIDLSDLFQTGRLLVRTSGTLSSKDLGAAVSALHYKDLYVLQFSGAAEARKAYKTLVEKYGDTHVFADKVFQGNLPKVNYVSSQALSGSGSSQYLSWGVTAMGMDSVQKKLNARKNKQNVTVAVLDTGVNLLDSKFSGRILNTGFNFISFNPVPQDFNGHGTHCTSIIVDSTPSNVKILPVKIMNPLGLGTTFGTVLGLLYAKFMGADVYNLSLNGRDILHAGLYDFLLKDIVKDKGVICVAAGNNAEDVSGYYPSNSKYVITVAALKKNLTVDRSYSNYGSAIDFAAPGTKVVGRYCVAGVPVEASLTGTSMACPHVAAAAALIKSVHKNYNQTQVVNTLKKHSVDIEAKGKDIRAGWGRINLRGFANTL